MQLLREKKMKFGAQLLGHSPLDSSFFFSLNHFRVGCCYLKSSNYDYLRCELVDIALDNKLYKYNIKLMVFFFTLII